MWLWQPQLPAARMDHGGSVTVPLWPLHSQPPSLLHSVSLPSCLANRIIHRTAVYGPVRTVVREGRCREAPPYPDFPRLWRGRRGGGRQFRVLLPARKARKATAERAHRSISPNTISSEPIIAETSASSARGLRSPSPVDGR